MLDDEVKPKALAITMDFPSDVPKTTIIADNEMNTKWKIKIEKKKKSNKQTN